MKHFGRFDCMPNRFSSSCAWEAPLSVSSAAERLSSQALYLFLWLSAFSALLSIKEKSCRKYDRIFLLNYNVFFNTKVSWCKFCTTRLLLVPLKVRVATNSFVSANSCELFALFAFFSGALWTTTSSISMTYSRLPFVSSATLPPYFFIAIWFYIYGS